MLLTLLFCAPPLRAQDGSPQARPVTAVAAEAVPAPGAGPVVLELFSSQACIFCPRADRLFADLVATQPDMIALACHVDYFDVKQGSLSQPFCTARQTWYERLLRSGPAYTPQVVMQGGIDVVGYKMEAVIAGLKKAAQLPTMPLYIFVTDKDNEFRVALPDTALPLGAHAVLYLVIYDRPHEVTIAEGRNKGQKITYYNIISDLRDQGAWPDRQQGTVVTAPLTDANEGFALLLQDTATGKILAAGKFKREPLVVPASPPSPPPG